jgi:hypothetical protein
MSCSTGLATAGDDSMVTFLHVGVVPSFVDDDVKLTMIGER